MFSKVNVEVGQAESQPPLSSQSSVKTRQLELRLAALPRQSWILVQPPKSATHLARALTVCETGALPDLNNVTIGIPDVAADFAVLGDRLGDELGSSTFP